MSFSARDEVRTLPGDGATCESPQPDEFAAYFDDDELFVLDSPARPAHRHFTLEEELLEQRLLEARANAVLNARFGDGFGGVPAY